MHRDPTSCKVNFLPLGRWRGTLSREDLPVQYIAISDHLDMVGVQLMASFLHTRKSNCDVLQDKVKNVIGPWKAGKFMPLCQRSYSINTYCLSKLWFRCSSINLRVCDYSKITANIRSWLFQDQLEKPEDFVLYRPRQYGGLDLVHVETKAQALLIRSFLESAIHPAFRRNYYHEALYRWHIEDIRSIINPGLPPYYDQTFFNRIKEVKQEGLLNITTMTTSMWYKALLENHVTHRVGDSGLREFRPCRAEIKNPDKKWERIWPLLVLPGLLSDQTSFLWLMVHNLLPTKERLFRLNMPNTISPICDLCTTMANDTVQHALMQCPYNHSVSNLLLETIQHILPGLRHDQVVLLDLDLTTDQELPVIFLIASLLSQVWNCRIGKKPCNLVNVRANLEASVQILRKSRHSKAAAKLGEIMRL